MEFEDVSDILDRLRDCIRAFVEKFKRFINELHSALKQFGLFGDSFKSSQKLDYRRDPYNGKRVFNNGSGFRAHLYN